MEAITDYIVIEDPNFWQSYAPNTQGYKESRKDKLANVNIFNLLSCLDNANDHMSGNVGRQEIADAFASWRLVRTSGAGGGGGGGPQAIFHQLNTNTTDLNVRTLTHWKDWNVLRHLIPPAKHYGFDILLVHANIGISGEIEVDHAYKDYGEMYDEDDYTWADATNVYVDAQTEWTVTSLGGQPIAAVQQNQAIAALDARLRGNNPNNPVFNYHFNLQNYRNDDIIIYDSDHSCYYDTLYVLGNQYASFLMFVPNS